jgi:hypothetical protein
MGVDNTKLELPSALLPLISRYDGLTATFVPSEWSGVAQLHDGTLSGSAVLLPSGLHLLTAAHVATLLNLLTAEVVFHTPSGRAVYRIASITSYPQANISSSSVSHDLALVTLTQAAPADAVRYSLYAVTDEVGQVAALAGYGQLKDRYGHLLAPSGTLHVGYNLLDTSAAPLAAKGWNGTLVEQLLFDYDDGTASHDALASLLGLQQLGISDEAMITSGDSGGGLFLKSGNTWQVAGINSYTSRVAATDVNSVSDSSVGEVGAATRVSSYSDWISQKIGIHQTPLPQPSAPPSAATVPLTVAEGEGVWFLVQLSVVSFKPASVDFHTVDGTAVAGQDYIPTSGTLQLAPGERWAKLWVQTLADAKIEGNETFSLKLTNPVNALFPEGVQEIIASRTIIDQPSLVGVTHLVSELFV